jgi:hypothetical protein
VNKKYVISDLRFLHEYEKIKEYSHSSHSNILIIRVTRPEIVGKNDNTENSHKHISETEYLNIPYDFEIVNDSTIEKYIESFENKYNSTK